MRIDDELYRLAIALGRAALERKVRIATAESCTGGLVAGAITAVAGSSDWFDCGFITYSNDAKIGQLAVPPRTIEQFGAVSEETALAMAEGALGASRAQWAVAVTGIAGPAGGTLDKPVGTVCFAWLGPGVAKASRIRLSGDRAGIRRESVRIALEGILDRLA
ncbi:MAG: CinA family protein [Betaproteobacteria bacterium]|jgi:nicotinamide-nucleotide amidase|nr:MAG: CinA family protein [Betaproteobacteria bacterium]